MQAIPTRHGSNKTHQVLFVSITPSIWKSTGDLTSPQNLTSLSGSLGAFSDLKRAM